MKGQKSSDETRCSFVTARFVLPDPFSSLAPFADKVHTNHITSTNIGAETAVRQHSMCCCAQEMNKYYYTTQFFLRTMRMVAKRAQ